MSRRAWAKPRRRQSFDEPTVSRKGVAAAGSRIYREQAVCAACGSLNSGEPPQVASNTKCGKSSSPPTNGTVLTQRQPTQLLRFIEVMEQALGKEAIKDFQPMQPGDVVATAADTQALEEWVGFRPSTPIEEGVDRFARWYREFYGV